MNNLFVCCLLTVAGCPQTASIAQQPGNGSAPATVEQCPDAHGWSGRYENLSYSFTITIPEGYEGFWNSASCSGDAEGCTCMSDHGRIIPLSHQPYEHERHIEVFASHGGDLDESTLAQAMAQHLKWIRKRAQGGNFIVRKRLGVTVDRVRGERAVLRYYDKRMKAWLVEDFIELLKDGDEYSLYLRTPRKNYKHDRQIFNGLIGSLTFEKEGDTPSKGSK